MKEKKYEDREIKINRQEVLQYVNRKKTKKDV